MIDLDLEDWERPRMRLFFSADIIGSTAYKHSHKNDWFTAVLTFYHLAEQTFTEEWNRIIKLCETIRLPIDDFYDPPAIWKTIGDEVTFSKTITNPTQAYICCHAWLNTIPKLEENLSKRNLKIKTTAWVADFPFGNKEIVFPKNKMQSSFQEEDNYPYRNTLYLEQYYSSAESKGKFTIDFIGKSIDTGFRLTSLASNRRFVISLELTYILSSEQYFHEQNSKGISFNKLEIRYLGRKSLKGVLNGTEYPIFWIDLDSKNPTNSAEDIVLSLEHPSAEKIFNLSKSFIKDFSKEIRVPFFFKNKKSLECIENYSSLTKEDIDLLKINKENHNSLKIKRQAEINSEIEPLSAITEMPADSHIHPISVPMSFEDE